MNGIDVSEHQERVDWEKVKPNIDFAIIRAGYGKNNIDKYFKRNADECTRLGIPFGVYWFSYAYTAEMARKEAGYCIAAIKPYKLSFPVCFDYEYDSLNYANNIKIYPSNNDICNMAIAFLSAVESAGYYAMFYSNADYLNKFAPLLNRYDFWYAKWSNTCDKQCGIWQQSSKKIIGGISGYVDWNISNKNYPEMITPVVVNEVNSVFSQLNAENFKKYIKAAYDVTKGAYGTGEYRKHRLTKAGYNANLVQDIVNIMMGA